jgi:hypothetical protein
MTSRKAARRSRLTSSALLEGTAAASRAAGGLEAFISAWLFSF